MMTETTSKVEWHYWCPNVGEHHFGANELHVGVTVETEDGILGFHTIAVLPPVPTREMSSQPEPFARAFIAGLKECTEGWNDPDGFFAGLRARGFEFPMPKAEPTADVHDVTEAVLQMVAGDREEAEGLLREAEAENGRLRALLARCVGETTDDEQERMAVLADAG